MAVNYKDLGLVNTREMFKRAIDGGWAVPAFNFNNLEQLQAIVTACVQTKSPVIIQVSKGARKYANQTLLRYLAEGAVEYAKELGCNHPEIVLHLEAVAVVEVQHDFRVVAAQLFCIFNSTFCQVTKQCLVSILTRSL